MVLLRQSVASVAAPSAPIGADVAQQYLAALKPAGVAISTAEAKLNELSVIASLAQVRAIVAPLSPALAKPERVVVI